MPTPTTWNPLDHHRGPFVLQVMRETPTRKVPYHTETLRGDVRREDVIEEAHALLTDPRDAITSVYVFSTSEQQHVTTYRRRDFQAGDKRRRGADHWTRKRIAAGLPAGNLRKAVRA